MASKAAAKRLGKEAINMESDPPPYCYARAREDNVLEWHFILSGPPDTPYEGGEYWGQLLFPSDYPFKPPGIKVQTPSGRFSPNTKICTSMSDFHPGSWNPSWSVANILVGLLSFMTGEEMTTGSVSASALDRRTYASQSHAWNLKQRKFVSLFPEYAKPTPTPLPNMGQRSLPPQAAAQAEETAGTTAVPNAEPVPVSAPTAASTTSASPAAGAATGTTDEVPTRSSGSSGIAARRAKRAAANAQAQAQSGKVNVPPNPAEGPGQAPQRGWLATLLSLGQRKLAFAAALAAYLFLSRLASRVGSHADADPA